MVLRPAFPSLAPRGELIPPAGRLMDMPAPLFVAYGCPGSARRGGEGFSLSLGSGPQGAPAPQTMVAGALRGMCFGSSFAATRALAAGCARVGAGLPTGETAHLSPVLSPGACGGSATTAYVRNRMCCLGLLRYDLRWAAWRVLVGPKPRPGPGAMLGYLTPLGAVAQGCPLDGRRGAARLGAPGA